MESKGIADIIPEDEPFPIEGDAIEGKCEINDTHIYSSFKEDSCYKIEGHICTEARSSGRLADHEASILIAKRAKFHPIAERPIPRFYYNFASNGMLESREKSYNKVLTDYLGLIQTASNVYKQRDYNLMKIKLLDQEGYTVMLTLWEKIAFAFNTENVIGKVLAVTSAKVTKHLDTYQLESTESTTLQVNPPIENLQEITARLKHLQANKISNPGMQLALSNTEPVLSIAELNMKSPTEYKNKKYTFHGRIKEFEEYRGWFTSKCTAPDCTSKLHKEKGRLICPQDHQFDHPIYAYCVNTIIMDSSDTISAVIYNDDMQEILGMSCKTLVVDKGFDNPKKLPPVLLSMIGKLMTFTIRLRENFTPVIQSAVEIESTTTGTIEQQLLTAEPKTPAKTNVRATDQTEETEAEPSGVIQSAVEIESTTTGTIKQQLLTAAPKTPAKTNVRARDQTEVCAQQKIPDDFAEIRYGNLQSTTSVTLVFTTNMSWDIKIKKFNESLYMSTGWSEVVKDIPLKENHFLEFEYENESVVHLHVYNEDGSNILLVPQDVKSQSETDRSAEEAVSQPPTYNKVVVVRKHFCLPTELAKLADFYDGKKIKLAFEHGEARTFRLRSQSNMVTYERFTIKSWKRFAAHYGITVNQKVQLTYDFQTNTLFVHREI
ncbi:hypothetical protein SSX86_031197 [Deinandra increscens subsp. villosa]|uniref:TF-B3 domain-containing protein n=1 Tax=Deinandra increscens subsp. villosa TaxID=3103831 RepID=A0AAP0C4F5_9ASTR